MPSSSNISPAIFLYGPPGSGKTAVGRALAEALQLSFIDLDAEISIKAGVPISAIFASEGEESFRTRERAALADALEDCPGILSLGGGTLLDLMNRERIEALGTVICLTASSGTLLARILSSGEVRPLLGEDHRDGLERLLTARGEHYRSFANQLESDSLTPEAIAGEVQTLLGRFHIQGMGAGYDVRVEPGALQRVGEYLVSARLLGPVEVVTDQTVGRLYGQDVADSLTASGFEALITTFPPGEKSKNLETVQKLWDAFLEAGIERTSTMVGLGGGVVTDVAGFAAATYLRGVRWVALPTSLLGMVDASLGGKTGIDLSQGKNLVGAFYPPSLVLADPKALDSLPKAEVRSGLAEVVKHGVISDPSLFALCEAGMESLTGDFDAVVRRAVAVKARVIQADPYESGQRAALNFGHTVGHAVEAASEFQFRHGEAIAIGMVLETRLAERVGLAEVGLSARISDVLQGLGLPTDIPQALSQLNLMQFILQDKKKEGGVLRFALPRRIGEVQTGVEIPGVALETILVERRK